MIGEDDLEHVGAHLESSRIADRGGQSTTSLSLLREEVGDVLV